MAESMTGMKRTCRCGEVTEAMTGQEVTLMGWVQKNRDKGGILFMDLRTWSENPVKGENKKKIRLETDQIEKVAEIYHTWQSVGTDGTHYEVPELYRSVGMAEIEQNGWSLVPSKYIEFIDHDLEIDFPAEMTRIQQEMREVLAQEKKSQKMLEEAFRGIGYGID